VAPTSSLFVSSRAGPGVASAPSTVLAQHLTVEAAYTPVCPSGPTTTIDPSCARRRLDNIEVSVRDAGGALVALERTDSAGSVSFLLEPGEYEVQGAPDVRAHITPEPVRVIVEQTTPGRVTLLYASSFQ